jgi:uncharacterized protein (TIGR00251 family)
MKFSCKVIARSSKDEVVGIENLFRLELGFRKKDLDLPEVKVYTKAVPVDGKANKEVIRLLAEALKVPKTRVRIVRGETSNKKLIEVDDKR